ncbi:hypothetical protein D3C87_1346970 [compost metagenome]
MPGGRSRSKSNTQLVALTQRPLPAAAPPVQDTAAGGAALRSPIGTIGSSNRIATCRTWGTTPSGEKRAICAACASPAPRPTSPPSPANAASPASPAPSATRLPNVVAYPPLRPEVTIVPIILSLLDLARGEGDMRGWQAQASAHFGFWIGLIQRKCDSGNGPSRFSAVSTMLDRTLSTPGTRIRRFMVNSASVGRSGTTTRTR